ncbi:MAG: glutaminyl-tRNA synthase (glutamine-hydrolyzing) subunit A [Candidatus Andersenbacteria bacterium RIFCSPHIGHO2_02_FULL_45_11]|uniref:Glutamyl-tRNA(Gln) amidotransferase subunit A n=1 Tax=Candidatus Andersenbacteria bacterium RIFCSPHIGHO2_12_FULL_45_11 TaxID=1797281 RepID=A0A1G1X3V8_9BACT|nr:MAG: glutaminyl-tRNA synthase (glutamine-hydrolyzing) subunit A [Candidatus Andersenbacteria bacterium RIFCSPHIGHO2_01_FULL_46_36]OGY32946.1 MAG: glutaminyl-tRNA synthase (glutamine-hydrolyzing) subunit A [Candidatus Andersenbacteria bacterium RIFCSPHIGHO2_02_FULL_45_11]OGY34706.1 MAG: glutaminyl-tRNA synthase (glutamine-hydrolyzing) subunit A [Candidatus Andersenbacteria bacterium RIFCSPHIGHO2_12_FULL_45_11]
MKTPHTVQESRDAIAAWEPHIHAFLETFEAPEVLEGVLAGKPIAIKDNIVTKFGHTSAASKMLENFQSPYNAAVVEKLIDAGAAIVGKANLDEFAMGSSTEYSAFGVTKNPWDISRVSGGSSGGSAAAVASGEVWGAIGTETGGSVRHPASLCGVVGVKPTYGRVSRHGLISYGSSLDQAGPMARTVKDAALLLEIIAGNDPYDATSSQEPVGMYVHACDKDITGMKIGVPEEFFGVGIHPEVEKLVRAAVESLKDQGAIITPISLSLTSAAIPVYYLIAKAEASTNLSRYDGLRYGDMDVHDVSLLEHYIHARGKGFGPEVKRAILMGTYALSAGYVDAWYKQASKVRTLIRREYEEAFKAVDVIAGPVTPEPAFPIGSKMSDPLQMYLADALTVPANLAGVPALSVPCGFTSENLPVGLQVIASHFQEEKMFSAAAAYEKQHDWHTRFPELP